MTSSTSWPRLTSAGQPGNNPKTFMKIQTGTILAAVIAVTASSHAQVVEKKSLNLDGAKKAIAAAVDYAKKNNAPGGVIAVVDEGGNLMALERLDGTFAMGATISIGKARTAVLFKKPTRFFEELINKGRTAMTAVDGFTPLIGGIPIPPTTCPSMTIGIPPIKGVNPSTAVIAVRPLLINSSKKRVGFLKRTAVRALPIEMVAPMANVPSRRSSAIRLPPSSTTAITAPGALFFFA